MFHYPEAMNRHEIIYWPVLINTRQKAKNTNWLKRFFVGYAISRDLKIGWKMISEFAAITFMFIVVMALVAVLN